MIHHDFFTQSNVPTGYAASDRNVYSQAFFGTSFTGNFNGNLTGNITGTSSALASDQRDPSATVHPS